MTPFPPPGRPRLRPRGLGCKGPVPVGSWARPMRLRPPTVRSGAANWANVVAHAHNRRMPGDLYYGDNLEVMRRHVSSESVDLVYLDPPFNSDRTYNLIRKG